jgi:hypothetical protein
MMYSVMALDVLGYAKDDPLRVEALRHFDRLMVDDGERFFFQPCFSPVWDTAIAAYALARRRARARSAGRPTGCCAKRSGARAIGPSSGPTPSLPAGPSNTATSSTRISTTPPW